MCPCADMGCNTDVGGNTLNTSVCLTHIPFQEFHLVRRSQLHVRIVCHRKNLEITRGARRYITRGSILGSDGRSDGMTALHGLLRFGDDFPGG